MPATDDRLRIQVHGIRSARGMDESSRSFLLSAWHSKSAWDAISALSEEDILVTNLRDKEVNLKVVATLDQQMRRTYSSKHVEINRAVSESAMLKRIWANQPDDESFSPEQRDQGKFLRGEDESVAV